MGAWTIREATTADAEDMLKYAMDLFAEPDLDLPVAPGEFQLSVEDERAVIARHHDQPNSVFLLALDPVGALIGMLNCQGSGLIALRHSCELHISVSRSYWGQGVGTALMAAALKWAKDTRLVTRIELKVYERNHTAIHLYRKLGFEVEGRRRRAVYQENQYLDDLVMALLL